MIRTIDIRLNAAHPELPLPEATTYQGAPSTAFLRGVPKACGQWQITAVSVAVTFPDNSTTTRAAVLSAGDVWVVTIPACATSGRTISGLRILADGLDENGDAVTGYVLGVADLAVATFDIAPAPGETSYALRYFDNVPNPPHKGDVAKVGNVLKYYDGTAWQPFAAAPSPSTSAPLMDGTASAGSSAAYARGDHRHPTDTTRMAATATGANIPVSGTDATKISAALAGKATTADATLTERGFSAWEVTPATFQGQPIEIRWVDATQYGYPGYSWEPFVGSQMLGGTYIANENATSFYCESTIAEVGGPISATRTALSGYQLGSQTEKPLASDADVVHKTGDETIAGVKTFSDGIVVNNDISNLNGFLATMGVSLYDVAQGYIGGDNSDDCLIHIKTNADPVLGLQAGDVAIPRANGMAALTADLQYSFNAATVGSGTAPTVTNLADRAINTATLGSSVTAATVTLPAATADRARDFFIKLTIEATTAPTLTFIDPATNTTANVTFGADSLADIDTGKNAVLFTEFPNYTWLVSVKHEEAAS